MDYFTTIVTINGKQYTAKKRRAKSRMENAFDVVFTPVVKKRGEKGVLVASEAITTRSGLMGSGMGPFGSPQSKVTIYCIEGWGDGPSLRQEEYDAIAKRFQKE